MNFNATVLAFAAGVAMVCSAGSASAQILSRPPVQTGPAVAPQAGAEAGEVRLFYRNQVIVKFADGVEPAAVLAQALAGDRESFREGAGFDIAAQATGALLVDLSASAVQTESTTGRFGVERRGGAESTANQPLDALIARLNADPRVLYAQKNYMKQAFQTQDLINDILDDSINQNPGAQNPGDGRKGPNDPFLEFQWHLWAYGDAVSVGDEVAPGAVGFPAVWASYTPKRQVVLAVIDTGQVFAHDDVDGARLLPGYDFVSDTFVSNDGDGRDADPTDPGDAVAADECFPGSSESNSSWHGSHVSGIAGLAATDNQFGIASAVPSGVSIMPIRVLGRCGGSTTDIVDALLWAGGIDVPGVPSNPTPAMVINASLGGGFAGCEPAERDAIAQLKAKGVVLVAAAGNETDDAKFYSPSGCADAFVVAASGMTGKMSYFSNFGETVDIMAPGGDFRQDDDGDGFGDGILSIVDGGFDYYQGTSMASPLVAAAVALGLSQHPDWTVEDATGRLTATARPRSAEECAEACGAGLMDVTGLLDG